MLFRRGFWREQRTKRDSAAFPAGLLAFPSLPFPAACKPTTVSARTAAAFGWTGHGVLHAFTCSHWQVRFSALYYACSLPASSNCTFYAATAYFGSLPVAGLWGFLRIQLLALLYAARHETSCPGFAPTWFPATPHHFGWMAASPAAEACAAADLRLAALLPSLHSQSDGVVSWRQTRTLAVGDCAVADETPAACGARHAARTHVAHGIIRWSLIPYTTLAFCVPPLKAEGARLFVRRCAASPGIWFSMVYALALLPRPLPRFWRDRGHR